jgi:hypothetical protein
MGAQRAARLDRAAAQRPVGKTAWQPVNYIHSPSSPRDDFLRRF